MSDEKLISKRVYTVWATRTSESGSPIRFFRKEPGSWMKVGEPKGEGLTLTHTLGIPGGFGKIHSWHGEEILLGFRAGRKKRVKITIEEF